MDASKTYDVQRLIELINDSNDFNEVKSLDILPEPDIDDGYYFISYSHKDYKKVLVDILLYKEAGLKIWYDRGLEAGKNWVDDACKRIDSFNCKGFVAYLSDNYSVSEACKKELQQAKDSKQDILFISLNNEKSETSIRYDEPNKVSYVRRLKAKPLLEFKEGPYSNIPFKKSVVLLKAINDRNAQYVEVPEFVTIDGKKRRVYGIGSFAFANCVNLKQIKLNKGLSYISKDAFFNCFSLKKVILDTPGRLLIFRVTVLENCFTNCFDLRNEDQFEYVGKSKIPVISFKKTFVNCDNIESWKIKEPFYFADSSFMNANNLKTFDFNRQTIIAKGMFCDCKKLESIEIGKMEKLEGYAFANCSSLKEFTCKNPLRYIGPYAFAECESLKRITLNERLKSIWEYAFANCVSLEEIRLPKSLRTLHLDTFYGTSNLKRVIIDSPRVSVLKDSKTVIHAGIACAFSDSVSLYVRKKNSINLKGMKQVTSDLEGYLKYEVAIND